MARNKIKGKTCIFLGPTLCSSEARRYGRFNILPPAAMGDIYNAVEKGFEVIGLIDGYFEQRPSVWHKEILWGLSKGVRILGSSSMGALRAAELEVFGMEGVGRVFKAFRDQVLVDDDEVAVLHAPAELDYMLLSDAMVDIRFTLEKASQLQILTVAEARAVINGLKGLHFPNRCYASVFELGRRYGLTTSTLLTFSNWLKANAVEQKKLDAIELLREVSQHSPTIPRKINFEFQYTAMWQQMREQFSSEDDSKCGR